VARDQGMRPTRVAFIGSRGFRDVEAVKKAIRSLAPGAVVVTGAWWEEESDGQRSLVPTRGVDRIAAEEAEAAGLTVVLVAGSKTMYGNMAGVERNPIILDLCDKAFIFWDGESRGTARGMKLARDMGVPHTITVQLRGSDQSSTNTFVHKK